MKNKSRITIITIISIIIISFIAIWLLNSSSNKSIDEIKKINAQDTFSQKKEEYMVYFWQESCSYCNQIEKDVITYSNSGAVPIYIVDMQNAKNTNNWYDWESHHKKYDKEIGRIEDGKEKIDEDVNLDDFKNDKEVAWSVAVTEDNKIIATHNTPYGNEAPETADEIEITGTPTMIKVKDGKFEAYAVGVEETLEMMK